MEAKSVQIEDSWKSLLKDEFQKPYFADIKAQLKAYQAQGKRIYPPGKMIFNAFNTTPVDQVQVVILGQDPYHNPGEAMGLSFSVPRGVRIPPSLRNIFKEIKEDIGADIPSHGDLTSWATQGVLLLNAILTVNHKEAGSHRKIGWQQFTGAVIQQLSSHHDHIVFMLWGNFAKAKAALINDERHLILSAAHPSPLARGAFFGNRHFSQANAYLESHGRSPIDWQLK